MNIRFLGVGPAFGGSDQYQSNLLIRTEAGRCLLLDCGGDIRFSLAECGVPTEDLEALYVSHLHGDHIGGMEWLALVSRFGPRPWRPRLLCEAAQLERLWHQALRAGLEYVDGARLGLEDYFDCQPLSLERPFHWAGLRGELVKMPHVRAAVGEHPSFGLVLQEGAGPSVFISTDTRFAPDILLPIAARVALIFHDCETSPAITGVHARYEELRTLPDGVRARMWLYHHHPAPHLHPQADGFRGFVTKGQAFQVG